MIFLKNSAKKAPTPTTLPSNWPSIFHHKCTFPSCYHPNLPQAVAGLYNCCGRTGRGSTCMGTYIVSQASADRNMRKFHDSLMQEETKKQGNQTLKRRAAQRKHTDANQPASSSLNSRRPRPTFEQVHCASQHGQASVQQVTIPTAHQSRYPEMPLSVATTQYKSAMPHTRQVHAPTSQPRACENSPRRF